MLESLELFQKVVTNKLFENTPVFLFLNKKDLFETMVKEQDISCTFPEYKGGCELGPSLAFIQDQFRAQINGKKEINIQVVSASWKRDIRCAFEEVKKTLYDVNRKQLLERMRELRRSQKKVLNEIKKGGGGGGCCR